MSNPTAAILIIGNEILSGRTQEANVKFIAEHCSASGIDLMEVRIVPDVEEKIIESVQALSKSYTYVFTSGGIGPTHDDITAAAIAKAFHRKLVIHPEAERQLSAYYQKSGAPFNEARRKMAHTPEGADLIDNPVSIAPGFIVENVYVLAGVPQIMRAMFESILPQLKSGKPLISKTITTTLTEGKIAQGLTQIQSDHPEVQIGSYPFLRDGKLGVSLVLRGEKENRIDAASYAIIQLIENLNGAWQKE